MKSRKQQSDTADPRAMQQKPCHVADGGTQSCGGPGARPGLVETPEMGSWSLDTLVTWGSSLGIGVLSWFENTLWILRDSTTSQVKISCDKKAS